MVPVWSVPVAAKGMCTDLIERTLKCFVCSLHLMQICCTSMLQILTSATVVLAFLIKSVAEVEVFDLQREASIFICI